MTRSPITTKYHHMYRSPDRVMTYTFDDYTRYVGVDPAEIPDEDCVLAMHVQFGLSNSDQLAEIYGEKYGLVVAPRNQFPIKHDDRNEDWVPDFDKFDDSHKTIYVNWSNRVMFFRLYEMSDAMAEARLAEVDRLTKIDTHYWDFVTSLELSESEFRAHTRLFIEMGNSIHVIEEFIARYGYKPPSRN
jgi:hypothetical protein